MSSPSAQYVMEFVSNVVLSEETFASYEEEILYYL